MSETEKFESSNNFDQTSNSNDQMQNANQQIEEKPTLHPKATQYIQELLAEKILLDHLKFPHAVKLIDQGNHLYKLMRDSFRKHVLFICNH